MSLTNQNVERAKASASGQQFIGDDRVRGFALRITAGGAKAFVLQARIKGKLRRITIGRFPEWDVAQARTEAESLRSKIAHGQDPVAERKTKRQAKTFGDLQAIYFERCESPTEKDCIKSLPVMRRRAAVHLKAWQSRNASEITRADVDTLHARIGKNHGHALANRVATLVRTIYNYGIKKEHFDGKNPANDFDAYPELERQRYLTGDEFLRVNEALLQEPDWRHRAFFPLSVLTGARKGEWLAARWEHIKLTERLWFKPTTKTVPQLVPLSRAVIAILESLPSREKSIWVFPGSGKTGHMHDVYFAWNRIRTRAGVKDVRVHDLRHSFASVLISQGQPLAVIAKLLNHSTTATTERYAHLQMEPQRLAIERAAEVISGK